MRKVSPGPQIEIASASLQGHMFKVLTGRLGLGQFRSWELRSPIVNEYGCLLDPINSDVTTTPGSCFGSSFESGISDLAKSSPPIQSISFSSCLTLKWY